MPIKRYSYLMVFGTYLIPAAKKIAFEIRFTLLHEIVSKKGHEFSDRFESFGVLSTFPIS